jgi:hypothetical protein
MGNVERSDNVLKPDYGQRGSSEFYRFGRAGAGEAEEPSPRGDLSRLRQSLGPEPEVVHMPQPTRRVGWFVTGFIIASVIGILVGAVVIIAFPTLSGKSGIKTAEFSQAAPSNALAAPRVVQATAPAAAQHTAPAQLANVGRPSEPTVAVRGITDSEIRFGISAPFSGPAKELGQNMKLGIEAAFAAANANGGVNGRQLRLIAVDDGYEPARTATAMKQLFEKDQVFAVLGNVGTPTAAVALPYALDRKMLFSALSPAPVCCATIRPTVMSSTTAPATPKRRPRS